MVVQLKKDLFDWQLYDECIIPENSVHGKFWLMEASEKPAREINGFLMTGSFHYENVAGNGLSLWIKFIEDKHE